MRPITVGITFTLLGELLLFLIWGVHLFPNGDHWKKLGWTMSCGIAMGATIGALVTIIVSGRLKGGIAAITAGLIYFLVLASCTILCYRIDLAMGFFGAQAHPTLFIITGGLIPAFLSSFLYSWLLYSESGRSFLTKVGY